MAMNLGNGNCSIVNASLRAIVVISLIGLNCKHHQVNLDAVSDLPEYFSYTFRFGRTLQSTQEKQFVLVTGRIDTTSESPPLHLAVIAVDRRNIFLRLQKAKSANDEVNERYSGEGYHLDLLYKEKHVPNHSPIYEGYFVVEKDDSKTQYEVVGTSGNY